MRDIAEINVSDLILKFYGKRKVALLPTRAEGKKYRKSDVKSENIRTLSQVLSSFFVVAHPSLMLDLGLLKII